MDDATDPSFWVSRWFECPCDDVRLSDADALLPQKILIAPLHPMQGAALRVIVHEAGMPLLDCNGSVFGNETVPLTTPEGRVLDGSRLFLRFERDPKAPADIVLPKRLCVSVKQVSMVRTNWPATCGSVPLQYRRRSP